MSEQTRVEPEGYYWSHAYKTTGAIRRHQTWDDFYVACRYEPLAGTKNRYPDLLTAILSEPEVFGYTETQINDRILNEINRQEYEQAMRQEAEVRGFISGIIETARKCQRNHD